MPMAGREEPFDAFVSAYRERLIGVAALVHLDPERSPGLVDGILAQVYASWPRLDDPYAFALRAVLHPSGRSDRSAPSISTFELVDVEQVTSRPDEDIRTELAGLSGDERQVLVLAAYARLPMADIARLLDRDESDVVAQLEAANQSLEGMRRRHGGRRLAAELAAAAQVPDTTPAADGPADHPAIQGVGRTMLRLRRLRLVAAVAILVVLAGFAVRQALPPPAAEIAAGSPASSPTPTPPCDTTQARCRGDIISAWRSEMADVVSEYLDPKGEYFTGFSYSYTDEYQGPGFWDGGGGALALDLYRMREGATEVYLQIATSRQYAIRCGQLTGRRCETQRFMDGNRYTLTDPFDVAHGLEAQHRPEGTEVITVVARNTTKARQELPVTRADLISLVSDRRLRLPPR